MSRMKAAWKSGFYSDQKPQENSGQVRVRLAFRSFSAENLSTSVIFFFGNYNFNINRFLSLYRTHIIGL